MELTNDIILLNRDVEHLLVQAGATRTKFLGHDDKYEVLQFVHFSDVHRRLEMWNRTVQYINHYQDYISFALHTGDYCGATRNLYTDLYTEGDTCNRTIYNCVGNHDTFNEDMSRGDQATTQDLLFRHTENWNANFCDCANPTAYYTDFPQANVRMIVLDVYYSIDEQRKWLANVLEDALQKGLCVITASHETTALVENTYNCTFHTLNDFNQMRINEVTRRNDGVYNEPEFGFVDRPLFEETICAFKEKGGTHICHLAGHSHHDYFGLTKAGVLNSVVPSSCAWDGWCDGKRVRGTKTYDCFNIVSIDANIGLLKIVRVGDNLDHYLRKRTALCYDYINKKVISNF